MKVEFNTGEYNERRYGKPWIAKVNFSKSPKGEYEWGTWVGTPGSKGVLVIEAEDGDIIAHGQKDNRNPRDSTHMFYQLIDGELVKLDGKAEAYKASLDYGYSAQ
jgi:hypothetical protein